MAILFKKLWLCGTLTLDQASVQCSTVGLFCLLLLTLLLTSLNCVEQGRLEPVETRVKNNKRGLGSKEPKPKPKVEGDVETNPQKPKVSC